VKSQKSQVPKASGDGLVRSIIRNSLGIKAGESLVMEEIVEGKLVQHKDALAKITPEQRRELELVEKKKLARTIEELHAFWDSPEYKAREVLQAEIEKLKNKPSIKVSEVCVELLDVVLHILNMQGGDAAVMIERALSTHFDAARGKRAAGAKSSAQEQRRKRHAAFLEAQDIGDTTKLARRLHTQFPGDFPKRTADASAATEDPPRGARDAVRQWKAEKNLRSTG
jgi:hypothetical protein